MRARRVLLMKSQAQLQRKKNQEQQKLNLDEKLKFDDRFRNVDSNRVFIQTWTNAVETVSHSVVSRSVSKNGSQLCTISISRYHLCIFVWILSQCTGLFASCLLFAGKAWDAITETFSSSVSTRLPPTPSSCGIKFTVFWEVKAKQIPFRNSIEDRNCTFGYNLICRLENLTCGVVDAVKGEFLKFSAFQKNEDKNLTSNSKFMWILIKIKLRKLWVSKTCTSSELNISVGLRLSSCCSESRGEFISKYVIVDELIKNISRTTSSRRNSSHRLLLAFLPSPCCTNLIKKYGSLIQWSLNPKMCQRCWITTCKHFGLNLILKISPT